MKHWVTWAEIPVHDIERAMNFYREVFSLDFRRESMDGYDMALFDTDDDVISGALVAGECAVPSEHGTIVYLNGGNDLNNILERITRFNQKILIEKTPIKEGEIGYFAHFMDTEGNRIGLFSPE